MSHLLISSSLCHKKQTTPPQSTQNYIQSPHPSPEITPFIALSAKSGQDWSKEMSEVKKTDHYAENVIGFNQIQIPTPDNYAMDKEVAVKVKDHKRKQRYDDEEDDGKNN
ncbi:hypothetical protein Tco_0319337 [Tanacetum coccineum]